MHVDPLVSVLLPVWNGERFLRAAIDSITTQTFRRFELIVVDDGSTDGSAEIAQDAAALDTRIRVLRRPHDGLPAATPSRRSCTPRTSCSCASTSTRAASATRAPSIATTPGD